MNIQYSKAALTLTFLCYTYVLISIIAKAKGQSVSCEANKIDQKQYCRCPPGQRIKEFKSKHYNGEEDRIWKLKCEGIPNIGEMCVSSALSLGPLSKISTQES